MAFSMMILSTHHFPVRGIENFSKIWGSLALVQCSLVSTTLALILDTKCTAPPHSLHLLSGVIQVARSPYLETCMVLGWLGGCVPLGS